MRWAIREATAADAPSVVALVHRFNVEDGNPPGAMTIGDFRTLACAEPPRFRVLVADRDGQVLGYTLFYPSYDTEHGAKGCYVQDLYVLPEARRCGIGRALMTAVARACLADGGRYLFWNALQRNQAGRSFYRRIGAREEPVVTLSLQPDALRRLAAEG
jgi:ribosomal protein S18 acetylase RimI-like enzyme